MIIDYAVKEVIKSSIEIIGKLLSKKIDNLNQNKDSYVGGKKEEDKEKLLRSIDGEFITASIKIDPNLSGELLNSHYNKIRNWCKFVQFKEMSGRKKLTDIYVHLNVYLVPQSRHISKIEKDNIVSFESLLSNLDENLLIHGLPGAGKTTSMKKLMSEFIGEKSYFKKKFKFPLLIRLREIDSSSRSDYPLSNEIMKILGCSINYDVPKGMSDVSEKFLDDTLAIVMDSFYRFLDKLNPLIVLDGFDEISNANTRNRILAEVKKLTASAGEMKVIITCRTGEIGNPLEGFEEYEIAPLSWSQIEEFSGKWIKNEVQRIEFLEKISVSPYYDTTMKPLSLAHLCAIYERTHTIPDKPKSIYRRTVRLLLEDWDEQREVFRQTEYANFDVDQKFEFLCNLAYVLSAEIRKSTISQEVFSDVFGTIGPKFKLKVDEKNNIIRELESHTGLFVNSGYETFEFSHKSLQEYLAAEYIVKMPRPPMAPAAIENMSSEFAVAIAISSEPSAYLKMLMETVFYSNKLSSEFYYSLINRLRQERPDFEDIDGTFCDILTLISAWYRCGEMKYIDQKHNLNSNKFIRIDDKMENVSIPPIKLLFSESDWRRLCSKLEDKCVVTSRWKRDGDDAMFIDITNVNTVHGMLDVICLPSVFIKNYVSKKIWIKRDVVNNNALS